MKILFQGDSITDAGRNRADIHDLGHGYPLYTAKAIREAFPDRDFEFMFYFDLETSIYSEEFVQLMCELDELCEEFKYLGSYTEVV